MNAPGQSPGGTPIRPARVVVVLNASDQGHYAGSGEGPHRAACLPWAELTFLADHDISAGLEPLLGSGEVDAVVFASNAFLGSDSREAIARPGFAALWSDDGPARDVGVVVLHQYLREGEILNLGFLESASFSFVGVRARPVGEKKVGFAWGWRFAEGGEATERDPRFLALARGYGRDQNGVWTRLDFRYQTQWEPLAWDEDPQQPLVSVCAVGGRVVATCRVPVDLTGATDLLGSLVAASLRPRGSLLVEAPTTPGSTTFSTALASAIDRQRFVHRVRPATPEDVDPTGTPFCFFDELIIAPEWRIDEIPSLGEKTVLGKLEQGGSIVATFIGPGKRPVAVRLSGQPQYAERANRLADWLVARLDRFKGDIWAMRAVAEAVDAVDAAYVDKRLIPQALRRDFVRRHLAGPLVGRIAHGNVDDNLLATLGTYVALSKLGESGHERLRGWVAARLDGETDTSVLAQALKLDSSFVTKERIGRIEKAVACGEGGDPHLLRAYAAMLLADTNPALLAEAVADPSLGLAVHAELLRTVVRDGIETNEEIFDLTRSVRDRVDQLAADGGGLEAVCIGNAALIELARKQGIGPSAAVRGRPRETDARTVETTELIKARETAERDADAARKAGRLAVAALVFIVVAVMVAAVVWIVGWYKSGADTKFGFATGVIAFLAGIVGYLLRRAQKAGIAPWTF